MHRLSTAVLLVLASVLSATDVPRVQGSTPRTGSVSFRDGQTRRFTAFYGVRTGTQNERLATEIPMRLFEGQRQVSLLLDKVRSLVFRTTTKYREDRSGGTVVVIDVMLDDGSKRTYEAEFVLIDIQWGNDPLLERYYGTLLDGFNVSFDPAKNEPQARAGSEAIRRGPPSN